MFSPDGSAPLLGATSSDLALPRAVWALPLLGLVLGAATQAHAQHAQIAEVRHPSEEMATTLPAVTVTASPDDDSYPGGMVQRSGTLGILGEKDWSSTPFNTTTYSNTLIENGQAKNLADLVASDPSVRTSASSTHAAQLFFIRGFMVQTQDVAFDGLYGIYPHWKGSLASIERVEILKGPATFMRGMAPSGAVGGGINIVPKRAGETPVTRFTASYLSDSNFGGHLDIGRRFGDSEEFGIRFNGSYSDGKTHRDSSPKLGEATLALDYRGERVRLNADIGYLRNRLDGFEGSLLSSENGLPSIPSASKRYFQTWSYWNDESTFGVVRGEFDLSNNVTIYGALGARKYVGDYLGAFGRGLKLDGDFTEYFTYQSEQHDTVTGEIGVKTFFRTGQIDHQLNAGFTQFSRDTYSVTKALPTINSNIYAPNRQGRLPLPELGSRPKITDAELSSFAVVDTMTALDDRLQLTLGARLQKIDVTSVNAATGAAQPHYNKDRVSPAFGLVVKPRDWLSFYANYVEGLSQGPTAPAGTTNVGQTFAPFVSKQMEIGTKMDFGAIGTSLSLFQIKQPSAFTDAGGAYSVDGEQRNRGIELNVFGEPIKGVRILGGAMYLDASLLKTAAGLYDGNRPVNTPRLNANLGVEWDAPMVPGLTLTGRVIHTAAAYANQANTQRVSSWNRVDLGARYRIERSQGKSITLIGNIENLFDKAYWSSGYLYRGAPRSIALSAIFDF